MENSNLIDCEEWKKDLRAACITGITGTEAKKNNAFEQVGYFYKFYAPAYLYKYYGDNSRDLETVMNNKMWYSAPFYFNDVFDCDIAISEGELFDSALKLVPDKRGIRKGSSAWLNLRGIISKECLKLKAVFEELKSTTGISCFSEFDDSLLMWAHYANNHRGICVEYNLMEISNQLHFTPVPIIYSEKRAVFHSLNLDTINSDTTEVFIESLTSKSPEWSYEGEWRIIRDEKACGSRWNKEKKGALLDMISPTSIILGCMVTREFENSVHNYCQKNKINLYKMRKNPEFYRLDKIPILQFDDQL